MRNNVLMVLVCLVSALLSGCLAKDENPDWNPSAAFPSWTYDAPFYHEPATPLKPQTAVGNNIPVYYTRDADFFIHHPNGSQQNLAPQVAIWYSNTCGEAWFLDGYYGLEQRYFIFHAEHDGHYWIRFVGPAPGKDTGQGVATVPPGQPHEIYVVDTHAPIINIAVTPAPWKDAERTVRHIYHIGDSVELQWSVTDMSLLEDSISLGTTFARFPDNVVWSNFEGKIDPVGKMKVTIPPEANKHDGIRFRMLAEDRAKNVGIGMTEILHVAKVPEKAAIENETEKPEELQVPTPITAAPEPKTRAEQLLQKVHPAAALTEPIQVVKPRDPRGVDENEIVKPRSRQTRKWISQIKPVSAKTSGRTLAAAGSESSVDTRKAKKLDALSIEALLPSSFEDTTSREPTPSNTPETRVAKHTVKKNPLVQPKTALPKKSRQDFGEPDLRAGLLEEIVVEKSHENEIFTPSALIEVPLDELGKIEMAASVPTPTPKAKPAPSTPAPEPWLKKLTIAPTPEPAPKKVELKAVPQAPAPKPKQVTAVNSSSGWNLSGDKLSSGTNRLFTVQYAPALSGKTLQLQFSSDGGNQWSTLRDNMEPGRTIMWVIPSVDSDNCRLRIVGVDSDGTSPLAVSPKFGVAGGADAEKTLQLENAVARVQR